MNETVTKEKVVEEFRCKAIREAAMRVVGRKGLTHATVQEIADEAGVAKGTVYLYFRSREEVLDRTMQAAVDELLNRIRAAASAPGPFRKVLERILSTQLEYFDEHKDFFRLYFAMGDGTEERRRQRLANRRRHRAELVAVLQAAARSGEIRVADPERAAMAISGATREVILRRIDERPVREVTGDVKLLMSLICDGLSVSRGKS